MSFPCDGKYGCSQEGRRREEGSAREEGGRGRRKDAERVEDQAPFFKQARPGERERGEREGGREKEREREREKG